MRFVTLSGIVSVNPIKGLVYNVEKLPFRGWGLFRTFAHFAKDRQHRPRGFSLAACSYGGCK